MSQWNIVSQKPIFKAKFFDVKEVELQNDKGEKKIHHLAERVSVACVFPLTDSDEIYLISQYRYMFKKRVLEAVAGYVEEKETPFACAKRELKEEAGITAIQWEEMKRIEMAASVFKGKVHLFLAQELSLGEPKREDGEDINLVKISLEEAVKKVMLGEISHSATMIGILLLDKLKREKKIII